MFSVTDNLFNEKEEKQTRRLVQDDFLLSGDGAGYLSAYCSTI